MQVFLQIFQYFVDIVILSHFYLGSWYNFNDSTVSITNEDSITHCKGYILFYTRQYPNVAVIESIKDKSRTA